MKKYKVSLIDIAIFIVSIIIATVYIEKRFTTSKLVIMDQEQKIKTLEKISINKLTKQQIDELTLRIEQDEKHGIGRIKWKDVILIVPDTIDVDTINKIRQTHKDIYIVAEHPHELEEEIKLIQTSKFKDLDVKIINGGK